MRFARESALDNAFATLQPSYFTKMKVRISSIYPQIPYIPPVTSLYNLNDEG